MITKNFKIISYFNIEEYFKLNTIYQCFSIVKPYNENVKSGSIEVNDLNIFTRNILMWCINIISSERVYNRDYLDKEFAIPKLLISVMNHLYEKEEASIGIWRCVKFNNGLFAKEAFLNIGECNKHIEYIQEIEPIVTLKNDKMMVSVERRLISLLTYLWDTLFTTNNFNILLNQYVVERTNENASYFIRVNYTGFYIVVEGLISE